MIEYVEDEQRQSKKKLLMQYGITLPTGVNVCTLAELAHEAEEVG